MNLLLIVVVVITERIPTMFLQVLSNKMDKSVLVAIDRVKKIHKYRTHVKRTTKIMAHDEHDECNVGDTVRIRLCRPLSKHKSYTVTDVLHKGRVLDTSSVGSFASSGIVD